MKTTTFELDETGLYRVDKIRAQIDFNNAVVSQLGQTIARKVPAIAAMKDLDGESKGSIHMIARNGGETIWALEVFVMPLDTYFKTEENIIYPTPNISTNPRLPLKWEVPENMQLRLLVALNRSYGCTVQYLVAMDSSKRFWRLPMANIYEDCKLCSGKYESDPDSALDAVRAAWNQFKRSQWNADLYSSTQEQTSALFAFKAEKDTFEQLWKEPNANWIQYCKKVSTEFISNVLL